MYMTLNPGDLILTGTPAGVGPIKKNDKLVGTLHRDDELLTTIELNIAWNDYFFLLIFIIFCKRYWISNYDNSEQVYSHYICDLDLSLYLLLQVWNIFLLRFYLAIIHELHHIMIKIFKL